MLLAFYKVDNSLGYERNTFNMNTPETILEKLSELPEDEVHIYDPNHYGYGDVPAPNLADFEQDYNDEVLDGGWWCIVINK